GRVPAHERTLRGPKRTRTGPLNVKILSRAGEISRASRQRRNVFMSQNLRANIRAMAGYTPGEQPRGGEFIKLNTNENPYPPSPRVFDAIRQALTGERLRKYPDPLGIAFRETAGRILNVD